MAICVGMLRLARLRARGPGVLGTRAVLARGWQEARLQGVRPLRYASPGKEGAARPPPPGREFGGGGASCRASLGADATLAGRPEAAALRMARAGERVSRTQRLGSRKCWPGSRRLGLQLVAGSDPARTLSSGPGLLVLSKQEHTEGQEPGPSAV